MRVVVNVNGQRFRVPCSNESLTVETLLGDVARRYEKHNSLQEDSIQIKELRGADGSVFDPGDPIKDVADDMEELLGVIGKLGISENRSMEALLNPANFHNTAMPLQSSPARRNQSIAKSVDEEEDHSFEKMSEETETLDAWAKDNLKISSVQGHRDGCTCVSFHGPLAVTGGRDQLVRVWDSKERACVRELKGHTTNVRCVDFQRDLVVSGGEAQVRVWNVQTGEQVGTLSGHNHYVSSLSLDEELRLVTGSWDKSLRIWKLPDDGADTEAWAVLNAHTASVLSMQRNGDRLVSGSLGGEIYVWNLITEQNTMKMKESHGCGINDLAWDRNLIFAAADMNIQVFTGDLISQQSAAFITACQQVMDTTSGRLVETLKGHTDVITAVVLYPHPTRCYLPFPGSNPFTQVLSMPWIITGSRDASVKVANIAQKTVPLRTDAAGNTADLVN